jgi:hypothetical protein
MNVARLGMTAAAGVVLAACGAPDSQETAATGTAPETAVEMYGDDAAPHDPDMDHGAPQPEAREPHAGHGPAALTDGAAADHARHAPGAEHAGHAAASPAAGDPHAGHAPATRAPTQADPHAGHAAPVGPAGSAARERGAARLAALVEALLEDPVVQERIEADPELRELQRDPSVRGAVGTPVMNDALAKLLVLVDGLVGDTAVRASIEADSRLRELWNEPGVRRRLRPDP